jgi:tyrosinase
MATMQSPFDPIFYLHHANIDRLTHAWALPDGKGIPPTAWPYSSTNSSPYWAGTNVYASGLSVERWKTYHPGWLGYDYADNTLPTALPPRPGAAQTAQAMKLAAPQVPSNQRPPSKRFTPAPPRQISTSRRSLGGAAQVSFDEQSYTASLSFNQKDAAEIAAIIASRRMGHEGAGGGRVGSVKFVVDSARMSDPGRLGGYYYALYLNMPDVVDSKTAYNKSFLGTLGAFQIAAVSHHGPGRLEFDLVGLLLQQEIKDFSTLSISWIRVDGDNPPAGQTINVAEARVDLAYEIEPVQLPLLQGMTSGYK